MSWCFIVWERKPEYPEFVEQPISREQRKEWEEQYPILERTK